MNVTCLLCIPCVVIFSIVFFKYPRWAVAGMIVLKPIIDVSWNDYIFNGINSLKISSGVFALVGIIYILYYRMRVPRFPISIAWLLFALLNFVSIFFITDSLVLIDKIDYFLRIVNGFIAFVIIKHLFDYEKDRRLVLTIFIAAGIFPMLLWLYQILSGNVATSVAGIADELVRIKGPYHDFWNFMFYGMQTLLCSFAYFAIDGKSSLFDERKASILGKISVRNTLLPVLITISLVMVYKSYSKAGWVILGICLLIWFVARKRVLPTILVVASIAAFLAINPFAQETKSLFRKEIDFFVLKSDTWESDTLFMGRYGLWQRGMAAFNDLPLANKLLGARTYIGDAENDYLRVLWDNGIIGFAIYVLLLGATGFLLVRKFVRTKDPLVLFGILVELFYVVCSLGFYPMFYPAFQWFMWGVVGFVLSERKSSS